MSVPRVHVSHPWVSRVHGSPPCPCQSPVFMSATHEAPVSMSVPRVHASPPCPCQSPMRGSRVHVSPPCPRQSPMLVLVSMSVPRVHGSHPWLSPVSMSVPRVHVSPPCPCQPPVSMSVPRAHVSPPCPWQSPVSMAATHVSPCVHVSLTCIPQSPHVSPPCPCQFPMSVPVSMSGTSPQTPHHCTHNRSWWRSRLLHLKQTGRTEVIFPSKILHERTMDFIIWPNICQWAEHIASCSADQKIVEILLNPL